MLLPKFCWGQYLNLKGPQYSINNCGPGMNHYCPSLILLNRGERTFGKAGKKRTLLRYAKKGFIYTLKWMKKYPNCPLRARAEASLRRVNMDLSILPRR
ncbi:MAG TPA: hypothetical protein VKA76_13005 [Gammaproteobacteria bacterium]|nr:hypothetical protein [Gammaproteobacteria bacterium]